MLHKRSPWLRCLILLVGAFWCGFAGAAEYELDLQLRSGFEYNSNINLNPDDEQDVSGAILALPITLTRRSERLESSLKAEAGFARYDEGDFDSNDQDIEAKGKYRLERGELEGEAGFKRDTTRDSEFLDSGLIGQKANRRERASAGVRGQNLLTSRNGIVFSASYADVSYDSLRLQDYDFASASFGWLHQWSERHQVRVEGYGSRFRNDSDPSLEIESDSVGAQVGLEAALRETLQFSLLAGWISVDTEYTAGPGSALPAADDQRDGSLVARGFLKYRKERLELEARVKSEPMPTGLGYLNKTDQLDLVYRYRLTESSRIALELIAGRMGALDSRIEDNRNFARGRVRYNHRLSERWDVGAAYTYSYQDAERASGDADSNAFKVTFTFRPGPSTWSR